MRYWYNNGEEQFHTKLMLVKKSDYLVAFPGGSGNFTRRNLRDFNLESELQKLSHLMTLNFQMKYSIILTDYGLIKTGILPLIKDDMANKESGLNNFLYKIIEKTGFSAF